MSTAAADGHRTAVTTPFGLFEFPVMCFRLHNATQTFQRVMNDMSCGLEFYFAYIDDVLIAPNSLDEHEQQVCVVLKRRYDYSIATNQAKCDFAVKTLTFLGHTINKDVCCSNPERIDAINLLVY